MKHLRLISVAAILLIIALANLWAGGVKVIANPGVTFSSISADDLKRVFLQETNSVNQIHVEPVLSKGGPAHEMFIKQFLGKTDATLQTYLRSLVFTGKGSMPKTLGSDAEMAAYVAKTKGAIGYVSDGANLEGVKTLDIR